MRDGFRGNKWFEDRSSSLPTGLRETFKKGERLSVVGNVKKDKIPYHDSKTEPSHDSFGCRYK